MGLCGFVVIAALLHQVGSAKTHEHGKAAGHPVWTLAMDWPRVAYASGKSGNSESIHVWNVATGATSVINGGPHRIAVQHAGGHLARGKRVVWVRSSAVRQHESRLLALLRPAGGSAHLLRRVLGSPALDCERKARSWAGCAGSRSALS